MHMGRFIFSQVVDFFPERDFRRIVAKYSGDYSKRPVGIHLKGVYEGP